jgi:hypothetical protein
MYVCIYIYIYIYTHTHTHTHTHIHIHIYIYIFGGKGEEAHDDQERGETLNEALENISGAYIQTLMEALEIISGSHKATPSPNSRAPSGDNRMFAGTTLPAHTHYSLKAPYTSSSETYGRID